MKTRHLIAPAALLILGLTALPGHSGAFSTPQQSYEGGIQLAMMGGGGGGMGGGMMQDMMGGGSSKGNGGGTMGGSGSSSGGHMHDDHDMGQDGMNGRQTQDQPAQGAIDRSTADRLADEHIALMPGRSRGKTVERADDFVVEILGSSGEVEDFLRIDKRSGSVRHLGQ
jgi:hypothetical protein